MTFLILCFGNCNFPIAKNIIAEPKELIRIDVPVESEVSIPLEKSIELCGVHRDKHGVRLFSQCWGCVRFSKEVP